MAWVMMAVRGGDSTYSATTHERSMQARIIIQETEPLALGWCSSLSVNSQSDGASQTTGKS